MSLDLSTADKTNYSLNKKVNNNLPAINKANK